MPQKNTHIIEVFRPGTFRPMTGEPITYTADDLRAVADAYDPALSQAPSVVGHPKTDDPAYAWAERFFYDDVSDRLMAEVGQIDPLFADAVAQGKFKKVSLSFFRPDSPANPKPGAWYPRHIGFLGAAAPAVSGLKPVSFADADTDVVEFAWDERSVATLFQRMRDFFIEQFGLEKADQVLPDYEVRWLTESAVREEIEQPGSAPAFSAPLIKGKNLMPNANPAAAQVADERERELTERERLLTERERATAHAANASFADSLVADGRLLPVHRDRLVNVLDAAEHGGGTVSFADGETQPVAEELRTLLSELPKSVPLGGPAAPGAVDTGPEFAAPDGMTPSSERLDLHNRALAYQRQHKTTYAEAVKAVEAGA